MPVLIVLALPLALLLRVLLGVELLPLLLEPLLISTTPVVDELLLLLLLLPLYALA